MAKFLFDEDDNIIADPAGELDYYDALNATVEGAVASIEGAIWGLVDDLEYILGEEMDSEDEDDESDDEDEEDEEDDDDDYVSPDPED